MIPAELRECMARLSDGELSVGEFEGWLVPRLPSLLLARADADLEVVGTLELGLAEFGEGVRSLDELRMMVSRLLGRQPSVWVVYPAGQESVGTSSSDAWVSKSDYTGQAQPMWREATGQ